MTQLEHTPASPRKRPLAPDVARLDDRSARAWIESMAVTPLGSGHYAVDAQSGNRYVVTLPSGTCSCPDSSIRGERCKHLRRVAIEINRHEIPPPGKRAGTCRACGHDAFLPEDGPALCDGCRPDEGDVVRDRETGDRLVVARVTDERADEWVIEGTDTTVADYETNRGYPAAAPVVEVVYPFSGDPRRPLADRKRYAFPLSRLERTQEQLVGLWDQ